MCRLCSASAPGVLGDRSVQVVLQSAATLRRVLNNFDVLPCKVGFRLRTDGVLASCDPAQYEVCLLYTSPSPRD